MRSDDTATALARTEFQRQHEGRNLRRHPRTGTYSSAGIAALWNQHLRTIRWCEKRQEIATKALANALADILEDES